MSIEFRQMKDLIFYFRSFGNRFVFQEVKTWARLSLAQPWRFWRLGQRGAFTGTKKQADAVAAAAAMGAALLAAAGKKPIDKPGGIGRPLKKI